MVTSDWTGVRDWLVDLPEATEGWQAELVPGARVTGRGEAAATGGPLLHLSVFTKAF
jgi:hypothetical protein